MARSQAIENPTQGDPTVYSILVYTFLFQEHSIALETLSMHSELIDLPKCLYFQFPVLHPVNKKEELTSPISLNQYI